MPGFFIFISNDRNRIESRNEIQENCVREDTCKVSGKTPNFCEEAAYQMLTFGFMEGTVTYVAEIKHLCGGNYLRIRGAVGEVKEYHIFTIWEERHRTPIEKCMALTVVEGGVLLREKIG